jgi:hypothetical protein
MGTAALYLLILVVGYIVGSFLPSYFKKKGENLATKEDIAELTKTAKEIEAKIDEGMLGRQRQWELKREVLLEAAKRLSEVDNALLSYWMAMPNPDDDEEMAILRENRSAATKRWNAAAQALDETRLIVAIVCERVTEDSFDAFGTWCDMVVAGMKTDPSLYEKSRKSLYEKLQSARNHIRKELGIERPAEDAPGLIKLD